MARPKSSSEGVQKEIESIEKQMQSIDENIKDLTLDKMNMAPKQDEEPVTKLSQKEIENSKDIYLKPKRQIASREKFNEKYREDYNFASEYVRFIPEHREIIGDTIELWTKPFAGMPAQEWIIPTGKPVWGPRYLAEQLSRCKYHRLVMKQSVITEQNQMGQMYGALAAETTVQRLDALPVSNTKSIFMGSNRF